MTDCLFCRIASGELASHQVWADGQAVAFLDIHPWHRGHSLVIPRRHVADGTVNADAWHEVAAAVVATSALLKERLGATGVNLLSNAGEAAGQEVFHFHVHVIPRYDHLPGMGGLTRRDPGAGDDLEGLAALLAA